MENIKKFRAWDEDLKTFVYFTMGKLLPIGSELEEYTKLSIKGVVWKQYTGLEDSDGIEIYGGDIVQWLDRDYAHNELIEYDVEKCAFTLGGTYINTRVELSVIGNIYQNPELIK